MKTCIAISVLALAAGLNVQAEDGISLPASIVANMGYRVMSSQVMQPSDWEKSEFGLLEKSTTRIKSAEPAKGKPNWYYRFTITVERFENEAAASRRLNRLLDKPPKLTPEEDKSFPLRKAFQLGNCIYTVATDVSLYYDTQLDAVLVALKNELKGNMTAQQSPQN